MLQNKPAVLFLLPGQRSFRSFFRSPVPKPAAAAQFSCPQVVVIGETCAQKKDNQRSVRSSSLLQPTTTTTTTGWLFLPSLRRRLLLKTQQQQQTFGPRLTSCFFKQCLLQKKSYRSGLFYKKERRPK